MQMKITNLKKRNGDFSLDIESFEITEAGIYGLVGRNGCGKTTLMKIIAGIIKPDEGSIDYNGLMPRDITMLLRRPYILRASVMDNLLYPLKIRKIQPDMKQVEFFLEQAELKRDQYAPSLSGGQQQKLALIRGLIFSPKFMLIDEAFSNMDEESTEVFEAMIKAQKDSVFLICSHQSAQINRLCDKTFEMRNGRMLSGIS